MQQGYLTAIASIAGNIAALAAVTAVGALHGGLVAFAMAAAAPPVLANIVLAVYVFTYRHPELRPAARLYNRESFRLLMGFGGYMLIAHVGDLVVFQAPNILISYRFGAAAVPSYAVAASMLLSVATLCYLMITPYWPAFSEAGNRNDWNWMKAAAFRNLGLTLGLITFAALAMVLGGRPFIRFWAGDAAVPSQSLLTWMAIYFVLVVWGGNNSVLLLSLGMAKTKALLICIVALVHVAGFWLLSPALGMAALPIAGGVALLWESLTAWRLARRHIRGQEALRRQSETC
jgi:O-antigen/teichoic acid export membrane protein